MATGANLQGGRGNQVSNLPPTVSTRTYDAEMWDAAGKVADRLTEAAKPDLIRRAQARGAIEGAEVAAGLREYKAPRFQFGDVAAARQAAVESAYDARTRQDVDGRLTALRQEHKYDPQAYEAAASEAVRGFIQGAPPEFAVQVETYAQGKAREGLTAISSARVARDEQEVVQALGVRATTLSERMIALAAQGKMDSDEYRSAQTEYGELQQTRADNPAVLYSQDQRIADDDKLDSEVLTANISRLSVNAYTDAGGGMAGYASATRFLRDEVLDGEAFKDQTPEARQRIYRDATTQLNQYSAVEREEKKVADEQERQRRAEQREAVGELRLDILLGGVTEAQIRARSDLDDGQKAGLVAGVRAQARREQSDARRDAALEAANVRGAYAEVRDRAQAGTLSNGEIADELNAGNITAGQAVTLRALRNRGLAPVIQNVLAPVKDASSRPGMSSRGTATQMAQAEAHAATWAAAHPNATLDEQIAFGKVIADTVFRPATAGRPGNAAGGDAARLARVRAVNNDIEARRRAGRPYSTAEANRLRNEAQHGPVN